MLDDKQIDIAAREIQGQSKARATDILIYYVGLTQAELAEIVACCSTVHGVRVVGDLESIRETIKSTIKTTSRIKR